MTPGSPSRASTGRCAALVFGHSRQDQQLPDRRQPDDRHATGARAHRLCALHAQVLDGRRRTTREVQAPLRPRVQDEARAGSRAHRTCRRRLDPRRGRARRPAYSGSREFRNAVRANGLDLGVSVQKVCPLDTLGRGHGDPVSVQDPGVKLGPRAFLQLTWRFGTGGKLAFHLPPREGGSRRWDGGEGSGAALARHRTARRGSKRPSSCSPRCRVACRERNLAHR